MKSSYLFIGRQRFINVGTFRTGERRDLRGWFPASITLVTNHLQKEDGIIFNLTKTDLNS